MKLVRDDNGNCRLVHLITLEEVVYNGSSGDTEFDLVGTDGDLCVISSDGHYNDDIAKRLHLQMVLSFLPAAPRQHSSCCTRYKRNPESTTRD